MLTDVVVAIVDDDHLSTMLPTIHQNGLGHVARAIRSERGNPREQLRRAGIPVEQSPEILADAGRLLLINAAARSQTTADILLQQGAITVWIVTTSGFWREVDDRAELLTPDRALPSPVKQPESIRPADSTPNTVPVTSPHAATPVNDHDHR